MARMSNKRRLEWSFFLNDRSRITYNELCRKCQHECKQSFRGGGFHPSDSLLHLSKKRKKHRENTKTSRTNYSFFIFLKTMYRASCGAYLCR